MIHVRLSSSFMAKNSYDVAVVGAGVFGVWTACQLQQAGQRVLLLDAYGPGNSRSSSGDESRLLRMGYGPDELYSRWAKRARELWLELFERVRLALFREIGVLWLAAEPDEYTVATLSTLTRLGNKVEKLSPAELERRYPQIDFQDIAWGLLEVEAGALMARQAVQAVATEATKRGVIYSTEAVLAPKVTRRLHSVHTATGNAIHAGSFVYACGPWLPRVFPELLAERMFITRQEVFYFGVPAGSREFSPPRMPAWISLGDKTYGVPDLEQRGVKIAFDGHGPRFDPETGIRVVTPEGLRAVAEYAGKRFPRLRGAPVVESRVCQYENTSNGDFLIDRHPQFDNVWLVGGGSGHGFKHGPALGEYVAQLMMEQRAPEPRFTLSSKAKVQHRTVF